MPIFQDDRSGPALAYVIVLIPESQEGFYPCGLMKHDGELANSDLWCLEGLCSGRG